MVVIDYEGELQGYTNFEVGVKSLSCSQSFQIWGKKKVKEKVSLL
jgi:hypothetical protein